MKFAIQQAKADLGPMMSGLGFPALRVWDSGWGAWRVQGSGFEGLGFSPFTVCAFGVLGVDAASMMVMIMMMMRPMCMMSVFVWCCTFLTLVCMCT